MGNTNTYSIFLLKQNFNETNSIKDDAKLTLYNKTTLENNAKMYYKFTKPQDPWWKNFWKAEFPNKTILGCALVFYNYNNRCFAFSYGSAYNFLKDESYEYDFGLKTTLNAVDPVKLRSADTFVLESAKRERLQAPNFKDITFFEIDNDSTLIKSLTGQTFEEYSDVMKYITGSNSVRVTNNLDATELDSLLEKLLQLYESKAYRENFPNIDKIRPEKDPEIIKKLKENLLTAIKEKSADIELSLPEIIDFNIFQSISFSYVYNKSEKIKEEQFDVNTLYNFFDDLEQKCPNEEIETFFNKMKVVLYLDNKISDKKFSIQKCLLFNTKIENKFYCLNDGEWFELDKNFVDKITKQIDEFYIPNYLSEYNYKTDDEAGYNKNQENIQNNIICLDRTQLTGKIEPCDIFSLRNGMTVFTHIKIGTSSSKLSHLFNQGYNSVKLLKESPGDKEKLYQIIKNKIPTLTNNQISAIKNGINDDKSYCVDFGIITKKDVTKKGELLPIFSRITLYRILKELKLLNIETHFFYIERK